MTDDPAPSQSSGAGPRPKVPYWHLWTDETGVSHQAPCELTEYALAQVGAAAPQWNNKQPTYPSTAVFTVQPVGWVGDWHENPAPQWIVVLSGRWWIESMDGTRIEQGPGEFSFGEDQGCRATADGKKGHRSGTIGDVPAVLMTVQLHTDTVHSACHIRYTPLMDGFEILDDRFLAMVLPNAPLVKLGDGYGWLEGPIWFADLDCLLVSDLPNNRILRWTESSGVSLYRQPSGFANGHCRDRQGRLIGCSHEDRRITRTELDGTITALVTHYQGQRLNSPNDVICGSDGLIWFTDPIYGINTDYEGGKQTPERPPSVYCLDPETSELRCVASDFDGPNGLALSPDEQTLYISEAGVQFSPAPRQMIRAFDVTGRMTLSEGRDFHKVSPGFSDGFRVDEAGNLWSSAADGVHCIGPDGTLLGKILTPSLVSNLTFGGRYRSRLFLCASHTLYAIYTNVRGAARP